MMECSSLYLHGNMELPFKKRAGQMVKQNVSPNISNTNHVQRVKASKQVTSSQVATKRVT
jgi:hypothetical protein